MKRLLRGDNETYGLRRRRRRRGGDGKNDGVVRGLSQMKQTVWKKKKKWGERRGAIHEGRLESMCLKRVQDRLHR